jgi:hypothetical protein
VPDQLDDGVIPDDAPLLRRIAPDRVVMDHNLGRKRPSSANFKQLEMSVDCETILVANGHSWHFTIEGYPGFSLVRFPANLPRSLGLPVNYRPLDTNPAHCEVSGKKRESQATKMAVEAEWVHWGWED